MNKKNIELLYDACEAFVNTAYNQYEKLLEVMDSAKKSGDNSVLVRHRDAAYYADMDMLDAERKRLDAKLTSMYANIRRLCKEVADE